MPHTVVDDAAEIARTFNFNGHVLTENRNKRWRKFMDAYIPEENFVPNSPSGYEHSFNSQTNVGQWYNLAKSSIACKAVQIYPAIQAASSSFTQSAAAAALINIRGSARTMVQSVSLMDQDGGSLLNWNSNQGAIAENFYPLVYEDEQWGETTGKEQYWSKPGQDGYTPADSNLINAGMNTAPYNASLGTTPASGDLMQPTYNAAAQINDRQVKKNFVWQSTGSPWGGPCLQGPLEIFLDQLGDSVRNSNFLNKGVLWQMAIKFNQGGVGAAVAPIASSFTYLVSSTATPCPLAISFAAPLVWRYQVVACDLMTQKKLDDAFTRGFMRHIVYHDYVMRPPSYQTNQQNSTSTTLGFDLGQYVRCQYVVGMATPNVGGVGALANYQSFSPLLTCGTFTASTIKSNNVEILSQPISTPMRFWEAIRGLSPDSGLGRYLSQISWSDYNGGWAQGIQVWDIRAFAEQVGDIAQTLRVEFQRTDVTSAVGGSGPQPVDYTFFAVVTRQSRYETKGGCTKVIQEK